jgi:hypothetical protein
MAGEGRTRRNSYVKKYEADMSLEWQERAYCGGRAPDFDYDQVLPNTSKAKNPRPRREPSNVAEAKRVCWSECPVRTECLNFALKIEVPRGRAGVYGGLTPNERDALHDQQRRRTA